MYECLEAGEETGLMDTYYKCFPLGQGEDLEVSMKFLVCYVALLIMKPALRL